MKIEARDLSRIESKLDTLIRLLALTVAPETDTLKLRSLRLHRAGMTPKDIAALCGTTANTVSVALSAVKREGRSGQRATK